MSKLPGVLKKIQMIITDLGLMKLKRNWNYFMKRKQMELLYVTIVQEVAGISTEKEALSIF